MIFTRLLLAINLVLFVLCYILLSIPFGVWWIVTGKNAWKVFDDWNDSIFNQTK